MEYLDSSDLTAARESYAYTYDNNNILTEWIVNDYPQAAEEKTDQLRAHTYDSYNDFNQLASSRQQQGGTVKSDKAYGYDKNGSQLSEKDKITGESRIMAYDAAGSLGRLVAKKANLLSLPRKTDIMETDREFRK